MGDGLFWFFVFAVQGVFVDMLIVLMALASALFLLFKLVNYLLRAQAERKSALSQPVASGDIDTQIEVLLRELEGW